MRHLVTMGGLGFSVDAVLVLPLVAAIALAASEVDASPIVPPVSDASVRFEVTFQLHDHLRGRLGADGRIRDAEGATLDDLSQIAARFGATLRALIPLSEDEVEGLRARAEARSGRSQPDLLGMFAASAPHLAPEQLTRLAETLEFSASVAWVDIEAYDVPPPSDLPPMTPDYVGLQSYRGPHPGIGADFAAASGLTGRGIRVTDIEHDWVDTHEDLVDSTFEVEVGQTPHPGAAANGWDDHGAAVLGVLASRDNGYGVTGLAPDADYFGYPERSVEGGNRRAAALTSAASASSAGDVILVEMQTPGPTGNFVPAEYARSVWTATRVAADAGVIVVAAAGNGGDDLDASDYAAYRDRGHSGAIIVGAGRPANQSRIGFSTFGSRVDLQGWGMQVFTLGYGFFARLGGDTNQAYTNVFSGTSSASPIVAGAVVLVQQYAADRLGARLSPTEMRDLLVATGHPQPAGEPHIGPLPDVRAAIEHLGSSIVVQSVEVDPAVEGAAFGARADATAGDAPIRFEWSFDGQTVEGSEVQLFTRRDGVLPLRLTLTADVGGEPAEQIVKLDVEVANAAPEVSMEFESTPAIESQAHVIDVTATDPGHDAIDLQLDVAPDGAVLERLDGETWQIRWTPSLRVAMRGRATFEVVARDDDGAETVASREIEVVFVDRDDDGVADSWELARGFDPEDPSDAANDDDGDGRRTLDEFLRGTEPDVFDGPSIPRLVSPADGSVFSSVPRLGVAAEGQSLEFAFRLVRADGTEVERDWASQAAWQPPLELAENERVSWTASARDPYFTTAESDPWSFVFSVVNDRPDGPGKGRASWSTDARDELRFSGSAGRDPEGRPVVVELRVRDEQGGVVAFDRFESEGAGPIFGSIEVVGSAGWTWSMRTVDEEGAASPWSRPRPVREPEGCSCSTAGKGAGPAGAAAWLALFVLVPRLRRRFAIESRLSSGDAGRGRRRGPRRRPATRGRCWSGRGATCSRRPRPRGPSS